MGTVSTTSKDQNKKKKKQELLHGREPLVDFDDEPTEYADVRIITGYRITEYPRPTSRAWASAYRVVKCLLMILFTYRDVYQPVCSVPRDSIRFIFMSPIWLSNSFKSSMEGSVAVEKGAVAWDWTYTGSR